MRQKIFLLLQIATFCVFAGRAYQHLFWDAPFRSILWSEAWMSWFVEGVWGMEWTDYVRSAETNTMIDNLTINHGYFYAFCAVVTAFIRILPKLVRPILLLGAASLILLAFMYTKEKWFHFGQFFEYSLQIGSPILLWFMLRDENLPSKKFIKIMKVLIGVTFVCHGLYALNYYPRPGNFVQMCMSILGIGEETAFSFLNFAGIMDFAIAIGIFLPRKVAIPLLIYACIWGLGTSIARVWANFYAEFWVDSLHQWIGATVMRMPHFLVPVGVLVWEWGSEDMFKTKYSN